MHPDLRTRSSIRTTGSRRTTPAAVTSSLVTGVAMVLMLLVSCSAATMGASTTPQGGPAADGTTSVPRDRLSFGDVDAAMAQRLKDHGLDGAADLVARNGQVLHRRTYGTYANDTVVPIASASKWLTSATIMALADEGRLALDDPVSRFLPAWSAEHTDASRGRVTIRQLLSHQAGLSGSAGCLGQSGMTLRDCANEIGAERLSYEPGTEFHYGNAGYTVAAAVAEVAGGAGIEALFQNRIARPLGLTHTSFTGPGEPETQNPMPAASGVSTLDDFGRFVAMMAVEGTTMSGERVLSAASVHEIERNQLHGLDTRADFAVQITTFATYGLGVWRDRAGTDDTTEMISGSGSVGFYPWIDRPRHAWGVLLVDDGGGGGGRAVRTSSHIVHDLILPAIDNMH